MSTPGQRARLQFVTITVAAAVLVAILWSARHGAWDPMRIAGLAIAFPSFLLLLIARIQLGNAVSFGAEANRLITTGLYSKIRNPVYVFGILGIVGLALYLHNFAFLAILVIAVPMQVVRARAEARVLEATFGDQYRAYRAQTWF